MKKVIIIGCGFAGLTAVQYFYRFRKKVHLTVIDKKKHYDFLPMLPDVIGRKVNPAYLSYPIKVLSDKYKFNFVNKQVKSLDLEKNEVLTDDESFSYDYLVIASGSETAFYGNDSVRKNAYKLDNLQDAIEILNAVEKGKFDTYIIVGGGYTGIEIATNIQLNLHEKSSNKKIIIAEKTPTLLGALPDWMKEYTYDNLKRLKVDILNNTTVDKIEGRTVVLSNGEKFENAMLIWSAGVEVPEFVQKLNFEKMPPGRLKVNEYLRINANSFAVGDCAFFLYNNSPLRMAVQFSIKQASCVARNVINSIEGHRLYKFKPLDLGYIIPMANNNSCGKLFGLKIKGKLATVLHYFMCVYRSYGMKNKLGIIKALAEGE